MLGLDSNGISSSVMETQQTIKQSKWLQENMKDVDDRVKIILQLIEGDADSFAQRAENYYQKRPQLVKEVEGLYRAYRALAATLAGNAKESQTQSGILVDSRTSPFGKQLHFKKRSNSGNLKDSDLIQGDRNVHEQEDAADSNEHSAESTDISSIDPKTSPLSGEQDESSSSSDGDSEQRNWQNVKLQRVLLDLQAQNKDLIEESKKLMEERDAAKNFVVDLQQQVSELQETNSFLKDEAGALNDRVQMLQEEVSSLLKEKMANESAVTSQLETVKELQAEILLLRDKDLENEKVIVAGAERLNVLEEEFQRLEITKLNLENQVMGMAEKEKASMAALRFLKGEAVSLLKKNKKLQEDIVNITEQKTTANAFLINREAEIDRLNKELQELRTSLSEALEKVPFLEQENNKQKILLADLSDEKRNAIRQLCIYIEVMKERNLRLGEVIFTYKRKFDEFRYTSGWKSLFNKK